jgi:hypothetical protein
MRNLGSPFYPCLIEHHTKLAETLQVNLTNYTVRSWLLQAKVGKTRIISCQKLPEV